LLTPLEIQKMTFKKTLGGYKRADVDDMFYAVSSDYEALYKENIKLKDRIEVLEVVVRHTSYLGELDKFLFG